jgi:hypothetical protein
MHATGVLCTFVHSCFFSQAVVHLEQHQVSFPFLSVIPKLLVQQ